MRIEIRIEKVMNLNSHIRAIYTGENKTRLN